jgi:hypothetical protein
MSMADAFVGETATDDFTEVGMAADTAMSHINARARQLSRVMLPMVRDVDV